MDKPMQSESDGWGELSAQDLEALSLLADGQANPAQVERAVQAWSRQAQARSFWHAAQVASDGLRSPDLLVAAARDEAFLEGVRKRMAFEPVILAPSEPDSMEKAVSPAGGRSRWWLGVSAAAGVAALALGVGQMAGGPWQAAPQTLVSGAQSAGGSAVRPGALPEQGTVSSPWVQPPNRMAVSEGQPFLASASSQRASVLARPLGSSASAPALGASPRIIRDAQLDRYLDAHQEFSATAPMAEPAALVRSTSAQPGRR